MALNQANLKTISSCYVVFSRRIHLIIISLNLDIFVYFLVGVFYFVFTTIEERKWFDLP